MASGRAARLGCQERDRELLHLRRRLAALTEEQETLHRERYVKEGVSSHIRGVLTHKGLPSGTG
jgi:hypothetical protein